MIVRSGSFPDSGFSPNSHPDPHSDPQPAGFQLEETIDLDGYAVLPGALSEAEAAFWLETIEQTHPDLSVSASAPGSGLARNLLRESPAVREVACCEEVRAPVEAVLGPHCFAVRANLFNRSADAAWGVPWHQDLTIPVEGHTWTSDFSCWSQNDGVRHVQPPEEILQKMLVARIHFDPCDEDGGPLRVIPASHRAGRIASAHIPCWIDWVRSRFCPVPCGGILLMRPLLLHASTPARCPGSRRVLHILFAAVDLPDGLEWYDRVMPVRFRQAA
ncbi:MAG: phytanoyl-CoA dioxygenase family protein [Verrucomicrobiae bacterium]|nr:phytanoyl-CoA dioxygenase family protein [Verrucomicrobiae bacterium]